MITITTIITIITTTYFGETHPIASQGLNFEEYLNNNNNNNKTKTTTTTTTTTI